MVGICSFLKLCKKTPETSRKIYENLFVFVFWRSLEKVFEDLFLEIACKIFLKVFFWRALAPVSLVLGLGLEHSCPSSREILSSEELSLASDFFESLALASSLVSSTPLPMSMHCAQNCMKLLVLSASDKGKSDVTSSYPADPNLSQSF